MLEYIESRETVFRLLAFFSLFGVMALAEWLFPKRLLTVKKAKRWFNNISLMMLNTLAVRLVFPIAAAGFAAWCASRGMGLFNLISVPIWVAIILSIVALDGIIWLQHRLFHKIPMLWRLHAVHHADKDLDVTSGARFHTLEILLSMVIKFFAIALLGAPAVAVILFEVILSGMALFNHSNVAIPTSIDRWLRVVVVTPDMHRIHHSVHRHESDTNFGFNLAIWDRLFHTYKDKPEEGHYAMAIGISSHREDKQVVWLPGLLTLPFKLFQRPPNKTKRSH
ncbi:sterol desaturase family protein [Enterovibrio nigricans]|uniref:Sterol desaturase/sphingolipid hydroxylase, fatty acid hydroxylase superfamily n=1 Tax=Enterovibrio nigricans DSM 22720 TaxID=1121868 RepID=A0A1T4TS33_9GAMM|nr:sterol desaturase family protein [Enterovibrio nigricans]PKF51870.1 sterol desaturase family protein [Enterovibrio nigricans]SKA43250.1 Sterol desaturase/sphingolipid hydroxylase, fatty acid hydroxylase superfamily [Enterovibrio nigricans DSM 22720]